NELTTVSVPISAAAAGRAAAASPASKPPSTAARRRILSSIVIHSPQSLAPGLGADRPALRRRFLRAEPTAVARADGSAAASGQCSMWACQLLRQGWCGADQDLMQLRPARLA